MTARHLLNATILRLTGRDIRLLGNWDPLPDCTASFSEISLSLGITERELRRCQDIADVIELVHPRPADIVHPVGQIVLL